MRKATPRKTRPGISPEAALLQQEKRRSPPQQIDPNDLRSVVDAMPPPQGDGDFRTNPAMAFCRVAPSSMISLCPMDLALTAPWLGPFVTLGRGSVLTWAATEDLQLYTGHQVAELRQLIRGLTQRIEDLTRPAVVRKPKPVAKAVTAAKKKPAAK